MICAGLDIGGTKIEARLFDESMGLRDSRRVPTPRDSADSFFAALAGWIGIYALFLIVKPVSKRAVTALAMAFNVSPVESDTRWT